MKKIIIGLMVTLFMTSAHADGASGSGNLNILFGNKTLDSDWEPVEKQSEFGMLLDFKQEGWPVSMAMDVLSSSGDKTISGIKLTGKTTEIDIGVRKIFDFGNDIPIKPFIGGGIAIIKAEIEASLGPYSASESDTGTGMWFNIGAYMTLNEQFNLGFEIRQSQADVSFAGIDAKAGGAHAGLLIGLHW
jgi:opacity protein-like surface antigen